MKPRILLSAIFIFVSAFIFAQDVTISGKVLDDKKQPLPGATVLVKGTTIGVTTGDDGTYSIKVPADANTLVISYIGFDNRQIAIDPAKGSTVVNVSMASSDIGLNQVVVSASKRKEKVLDAPASISVIGTEKLERNITTSPVEQLKSTPGVDIMRTGLVSSNVVIRGFNNIFSGAVLNVVDNRIGSVPSLRINAYQLVPTSNLDYDRIEVVRGPASALYGPNATSGVVHIMTKSPLDQKNKFETTVAMTSGFTVLDKDYKQFNNGSNISGNIINPEIRHSGRLLDGKLGYKVSGSYFQAQDYPNYDPREPYEGDTVIFGSARNGEVFKPDTLQRFTHVDTGGRTILDSARQDIRVFNKDFSIRKYTFDGRIDIKPINDITITFNGGLAGTRNVELTGLGAAQGGAGGRGWIYWYFQTRFKWKDLFVQYFINSSDAGNTFLIPQLTPSGRASYGSDNPYQVQLLIDKSKMHVLQVQHAYNPLENLHFVYGIDGLFTRPDTKGSINGRFETRDNVNQIGGYIQGDYEPLKWLKLVAAIRIDYNSIVKNVAASPRAAIVFKPKEGHNIRITYNRAFDSPTTLNQFLDLSNGYIPNGINVRGIGNPYGWNYKYDDQGQVQFRTAPWRAESGNWVSFGDNSVNSMLFDSLVNYTKATFTKALGGDQNAANLADGLVNSVFASIQGNGTVTNAQQLSVDYANLAQRKSFDTIAVNSFQNLKKINNSFTQTLELGYKGVIAGKLSIQVDGYWTRVSQYVSALRSASGAVLLDHKSYLGSGSYDNASGNYIIDPNGQLYKNLYANGTDSTLNTLLLSALDNQPALQNSAIVPSLPGTVWDELVVLSYNFPLGTITPNDDQLIKSDYILTYKNVGRLDVFGIDLGLQYDVVQTEAHNLTLGANLSWVDKDKFTLTSGETIYLNAPKIKTGFNYDHLLKKSGFGYGFNFRYQMGYYASSSIYEGDVKPAYLLDARVSYRPPFYPGLLLSVNVNNLTNYQWQSFPGTPKMGTAFFARAQVTFGSGNKKK